MTQIGVRCVRGLISHEECRRCSIDPLHPCDWTPDMLEQMRAKPGDRHFDPDAFSPTGLLDCDRKHALSADRDYYLDIETAYPLLRGNLWHGLMETSDRYPGAVGIIRETEMEVQIETGYGPQRMTGKPDLIVVNRLEEGEEGATAYVQITDYKSTNEVKHELVAAQKDHVRQVNMYAWLVRRWLPLHHAGPLTVVVETLEIEYGDFKKPRRFTSAGWRTAKGKRLNRTKPYQYETLELEPVTIYPDDLVERNIRRMIEAKIEARTVLPPAYEPGDDHYWKCERCPVAAACRELAEQGL